MGCDRATWADFGRPSCDVVHGSGSRSYAFPIDPSLACAIISSTLIELFSREERDIMVLLRLLGWIFFVLFLTSLTLNVVG